MQQGWAHPQRQTFARMQPRWGALCDMPDLELFPTHFGITQRVMFRAALKVRITRYTFAMLAKLRTWGVLRQPVNLAGMLNFIALALDFMGHFAGRHGGMRTREQHPRPIDLKRMAHHR